MKNGLSLIILLAPALVVILVLFAGGLALGLSQSLGYMPIIGAFGFSLQAYLQLLRSPGFVPSLLLTIFVSVVATGFAVVLAVATALTLRKRFVGKKIVSFLYQFPLTIPHLVVAVGMMMLISQSGLLSRAAFRIGLIGDSSQFPILVFDDLGIGIILVYIWKEVPFIGLIALAVLQTIGSDYEEQARTLGANSWQSFRHVLLPLMTPGIVPGSIIIFAYTFSSFEVPFLLGKSYPAMLSVLSYRLYVDVDLDARPQAMAMSILIALFVLILVLVYRRLSQRFVRRLA
ncbi:MAG: sugar ABC transporter permease [Spirochaetaceae bacterium]|nr:MAG: sugar ABC transporter permease [Spirochaetaceae bacterium]